MCYLLSHPSSRIALSQRSVSIWPWNGSKFIGIGTHWECFVLPVRTIKKNVCMLEIPMNNWRPERICVLFLHGAVLENKPGFDKIVEHTPEGRLWNRSREVIIWPQQLKQS